MNLSSACFAIVSLVVICAGTTGAEGDFEGNIWAVLVAGSNGYFNYRHQADVCHAYQVLKAHGLPDERIIVMMYDDIANDTNNPNPGVIINQPNGKNVYVGVPKDYVGREVTPKNFLAVLSGDEELASQGKKVLKSTEADHVFVYFSDHGAPGVVAFPNGELLASDLMKTLNQMHTKNAFKRLVFYLESCESGSMFEGRLDANKNIYAITAANAQESSYAAYWDDEVGAYLGDEFSVAWLEESDKRGNLDSETVKDQYNYLVKDVNSSHVMQYGDPSIAGEPLGRFQGEKVASPDMENIVKRLSKQKRDVVPAPDVPIITAKRLIKLAKDPFEKAQRVANYRAMVNARDFVNATVTSLARKLESHVATNEDLTEKRQPITRPICYEKLFKKFDSHCFDVSKHTFAMRFLYVLVNACESLPDESSNTVRQLSDIIVSHCSQVNLKDTVFSRIL